MTFAAGRSISTAGRGGGGLRNTLAAPGPEMFVFKLKFNSRGANLGANVGRSFSKAGGGRAGVVGGPLEAPEPKMDNYK